MRKTFYSIFTICGLATLGQSPPVLGQTTTVHLSGIVTDSSGVVVADATVKLQNLGVTTKTNAGGEFSLGNGVTALFPSDGIGHFRAQVSQGKLGLELPEAAQISVQALNLNGKVLGMMTRDLGPGSHALQMPSLPVGLSFLKVTNGNQQVWVQAISVEGELRSPPVLKKNTTPSGNLEKVSATALYDVITVEKTGFQKAYVSIATSDSSGMKIRLLKEGSTKFSFFVTSLKGMQELSKSTNGFGGDLRFGETGPGAGLRGADKICATLAEKSLVGASVKGWRAFLSVTEDAAGKQVNAIDRIGDGPWYDRLGRVMAPKKADLLNTRPMNGDAAIQNDLPNENGIPNHKPDPSLPADDNHHTVTGSSTTGTLASATATCKDWTTSEGTTANGKPSCGFSWPRGSGGSNGSNWMSTFNAPGCAAGYHFDNTGGQASAPGSIIGGGGGYGGIYCFALNP